MMNIEQDAVEILDVLQREQSTLFEHYCEWQVLNRAIGLTDAPNPIESISFIALDVRRFIAQALPDHDSRTRHEIFVAMGKALWAAQHPQRLFNLEPMFLQTISDK